MCNKRELYVMVFFSDEDVNKNGSTLKVKRVLVCLNFVQINSFKINRFIVANCVTRTTFNV